MSSLHTNDEATEQMRAVAERVRVFVNEYDWQTQRRNDGGAQGNA